MSKWTAEAWLYEGRVHGKAHHVTDSEEAICGAPMWTGGIERAETGFPACRHCMRHAPAPVPFAFYSEAQEATQGGRA